MTTNPDEWVYGDFAPDPNSRDLVGLKARWILDQLPATTASAVLDFGAGEDKHLQLVRKVRPQARLAGVDIRARCMRRLTSSFISRWSRATRNWTPIGLLVRNPPRADLQAPLESGDNYLDTPRSVDASTDFSARIREIVC